MCLEGISPSISLAKGSAPPIIEFIMDCMALSVCCISAMAACIIESACASLMLPLVVTVIVPLGVWVTVVCSRVV